MPDKSAFISFAILFVTFFLGEVYPQETQKTKENQKPAQKELLEKKDKKTKGLEEDFSTLLEKELKRQDPASSEDAKEISWDWQILKTTIVLIIMILIFLGIWKVYLFKKKIPVRTSQVLQLLYEYPMANGKIMQIVQLNNKLLLLGLSEAGIQLITEINDKNSIDQIKLDCEKENQKEKTDFLAELSRAIKDKVSGLINPQEKNFEMKEGIAWNSLRSSAQKKIEDLKKGKNLLQSNENVE